MSQSKTHSAYESAMNLAVGMVISFGAQLFIFPALGIVVTLGENVVILVFFTVISFFRSYFIRRFWNRKSSGVAPLSPAPSMTAAAADFDALYEPETFVFTPHPATPKGE